MRCVFTNFGFFDYFDSCQNNQNTMFFSGCHFDKLHFLSSKTLNNGVYKEEKKLEKQKPLD